MADFRCAHVARVTAMVWGKPARPATSMMQMRPRRISADRPTRWPIRATSHAAVSANAGNPEWSCRPPVVGGRPWQKVQSRCDQFFGGERRSADAAVRAQQFFAVFGYHHDQPETCDGFARDIAAIDRLLPHRQPA